MTALRCIIAILVTLILGAFGVMNGYYGALGVYIAFEAHESRSSGAMVYWLLLLIGLSCVALAVSVWMWVFKCQTRRQLSS